MHAAGKEYLPAKYNHTNGHTTARNARSVYFTYVQTQIVLNWRQSGLAKTIAPVFVKTATMNYIVECIKAMVQNAPWLSCCKINKLTKGIKNGTQRMETRKVQ